MSEVATELAAEAQVSAARRRRVTPSERRFLERNAKLNRKRRRYRSKIERSDTGQRASVTVAGGGRKRVRKKFYFTTYDAQGNTLGTFWLTDRQVNNDTADKYQEKHGVKHPARLPVRDQ